MLDVTRLRALREVARHGSIAGAAAALRFTPSAVSQQLAKLERESGVRLLERGPRSVRLTEAGRALVARAEVVLAELAEAEAEIRTIAGIERRTVRVASFPTAGAVLMPPAIAALGRDHPGVQVSLVESDPLVALDQLRLGETDVGLLFEYEFVPLPRHERIELRLLVDEPMHVVLPRRHKAAARAAVRLADLATEPWIKATRRSSCHPFTVRACRAAGFEPTVTAEFDDYRAMANLVAAGMGVAWVPEMVAGTIGDVVEVRPVVPNPPRRRIFAAHRERDAGAPAVAAVLEALERAAAMPRDRAPLALVGP